MLLTTKNLLESAPVTGHAENVNITFFNYYQECVRITLVFPFHFQIMKLAIKEYSSSDLIIKQENDFHSEWMFDRALNEAVT